MSDSEQDVRAMCLEFACGLTKTTEFGNVNCDKDEIIKIAEAFYNFVMNEGPAKPTLTVIKTSNERKDK